MKARTGPMLLLVAVAVLGLAGVAVAGQGPSVTVTNTPLPVTGTVNVGNAVSITGTVSTKDVNEAGRTPRITRSQILPGSGCFGTSDCSNYSEFPTAATFDLPQVPAGKRWIVQSASGGFTEGAGHTIQIELGAPRPTGLVFDGDRWIFGGPFFTGTAFNSALFAANPQVIFEPGETPFVRVSVSGSSMVGYSVITFSGYLIDAEN